MGWPQIWPVAIPNQRLNPQRREYRMDSATAYDFFVQGVFWESLGLSIWFAWHLLAERRWTVGVITGLLISIFLQFARVQASYIWGITGMEVRTWPAAATTAGIFFILLLIAVLAVIGKLTRVIPIVKIPAGIKIKLGILDIAIKKKGEGDDK
jgi:hypothetical protein